MSEQGSLRTQFFRVLIRPQVLRACKKCRYCWEVKITAVNSSSPLLRPKRPSAWPTPLLAGLLGRRFWAQGCGCREPHPGSSRSEPILVDRTAELVRSSQSRRSRVASGQLIGERTLFKASGARWARERCGLFSGCSA
jgi:hypothetical protein